MQSRSDLWKEYASKGNIPLETVAVIDGVEYPASSAPVIERGAFSDEPAIGGCVTASLQISILTDDDISKSAETVIKARYVNGDTVTEWLEEGTFYVSKRSKDYSSGLLTLTCYDKMLMTNKDYFDSEDEGVWPQAMSDVVNAIADWLGIEIDERTEINTGEAYYVPCPTGLTVMQVLGHIAAAHGGNWIVTPQNKLRLVPLAEASEESADDEVEVVAVLGALTQASDMTISGITVEGTDGTSYTAGDDSAYILTITELPCASQEICDDLYTKLGGLTYHPYTMTQAIYDPAAEIGDTITYADQVRSILYNESATLDVAHRATASAPSVAEAEDEYPYLSSTAKLEKSIAQVSASIATTAEKVASSIVERTAESILATVSETYATQEGTVAGVVAYYAISDSGTEYPEQSTESGGSALAGEAYADVALAGDAGWTEDMPDYNEGDYVWVCYLITYADETTEWTVPSLLVDGSVAESILTLSSTTAAVKILADSILQSITATNASWYTGDYVISATSCGTPDDAGYNAAAYKGVYYLDQETGYVYYSNGSSWTKEAELTSTAEVINTTIEQSITDSAASITSSITSSYEKYVADALESYSTTTVMENYITQTVGDSENSIKEYVAENYTTADDVEKAVSASLVLEIVTDEETGEKYGVLSANADCIKLTGSDIEIETDDLTLADGSATFSGSLEAASGTFKGTLEAVDGTFTGTLSGVDGTFEGELVAANGTFGTITGGILMSSNYVEDESGIYIDLNNGTINCASLTASISDGLLLKVSETYATLEDYDTLEALIDDSVASVVAYYAISDSGTDYPEQSTESGGSALAGEAYADVALAGDADWTEDMPEYEDGDYVWMCHLITYVSGETKWTVPSLIVDGSLSTRVATLKETTASIQVLTDSIMQAVTTTSSTWYTGDYVVSVTSCGTPDDEGIEASYYSGSYYLDQETGYLYYSDGSSWSKAAELTSTTEKLQSLIESTESSILLSVSQEYALNATAVYYGTCDNISAYPAKTIECDNFTEDSLTAGATIYVTFVNGCTCYSGYSISLIINGTGAVATYINGEALTESNCPECNAGETIAFIYDGEHWNVQLSETAIQASLALEILTDSNGKKYGALSANADYIKLSGSELEIETDEFTLKGGSAVFSGSLEAASGTFNGTLEAVSGTFGTITAGILKSSDYAEEADEDEGITTVVSGLKIDLDNSTIMSAAFSVNADGDGGAKFSGTLESPEGTIGGFSIGETALYNGTESIESCNAGAYVGTDGIRYVAADGNVYSFVQLDEDGIALYDNTGYTSTSGSHHYVANFSKSAVSIGFHTANDDADFGGGGFLIGCEADGSYPKFTAYGSNAYERLVIYPGITTSGISNGYIETDLSTTISNDLTVAGVFSVECTDDGDEPLTATLKVGSGWVYVGDGDTTKPVLAGMNGELTIGSITTGAWTAFSVTFDSGGFSDVPNVILTVRHYSAAAHYVKLGTVSTTGFTGYYYASNGTSIVIHWLALGL